MKRAMITVVVILILASCKKTTVPPIIPIIPNGTYKGTFQRQNPIVERISHVTINFSGNEWTGETDTDQYPGLCNGTYSQLGSDSISFVNKCVWPADFDWSFILNRDYKIKFSGKNIEISRTYVDTRDVYELTKQ